MLNARIQLKKHNKGLLCLTDTSLYILETECVFWEPTAHFNISKQGSIFLEGPEDDYIRIETC